jgi:hypothetical protein
VTGDSVRITEKSIAGLISSGTGLSYSGVESPLGFTQMLIAREIRIAAVAALAVAHAAIRAAVAT